MKVLKVEETVKIPEGIKVEVRSRVFKVTGPRGTLTKALKHVDMETSFPNPQTLKITMWHATRKHNACLRTVCTHIQNMIKGVTNGFQYKMRLVYAHFPINASVVDAGKCLEIRNFLGERILRKVPMLDGVQIEMSKSQKDELVLVGNDIENVSQSAANIQQICRVKNKDIRKFLDGIYVSEKGEMKTE
ncbi:hypothetical protein MP638_004376 [Amoeboaphelidium occidentale]|jgi:large subunit ribosomal protein L9e|nr:hypothetical protein MP638_004376 [Amoeboaphelidium occidentale]